MHTLDYNVRTAADSCLGESAMESKMRAMRFVYDQGDPVLVHDLGDGANIAYHAFICGGCEDNGINRWMAGKLLFNFLGRNCAGNTKPGYTRITIYRGEVS